MKKITFLLLASFLMLNGWSQSAKVQSCINYLKTENYKKAKLAIDAAVIHPKTLNDAKSWYYHGQTYQLLNSQCVDKQIQEYCDLAPGAIETALSSYMKALNLNWTDPKWNTLDIMKNDADFQVFIRLVSDKKNIAAWEITYDILYNRMNSMAISFFNQGVNMLNSENKEDNKKSITSFDKSIRLSSMMRYDTLAFFYSAIAAEKAENWKVAAERYSKLIELDYGKDENTKMMNYRSLAVAQQQLGDTLKYVETLKKGADLFGGSSTLMMDMLINYYLTSHQSDQALDYLDKAIEKNPANETYYFAKGTLHDELGELTLAEPAYLKAIEIKADFYDAIYNLGVLYNNQAVEIFTKARDLPMSEQKKYEKMMEEGKVILKKALPYMEKTHEMQPDDINPVISLKGIYYTLGLYDKSNEMKAIIDAYEANKK